MIGCVIPRKLQCGITQPFLTYLYTAHDSPANRWNEYKKVSNPGKYFKIKIGREKITPM